MGFLKNLLFEDETEVKNKKKAKKNKPKVKWSKKNIIITVLLSLGIFFIGIATVFALYIIFTAPDFDRDLLYNKEMTIINDKNGEEFARVGAQNRELVYYDELPEVLIDAIVATEDARFFQHNGLDIARFAKATIGQLLGRKGAGGASTLTMQVTKNTYTSTDAEGLSGIIRKFTDIYFSIFKIEKVYTKQEIIEFYVNAPWLGEDSWGVEAASQAYFGKSVKDLSLSEAALIAGIFNAPSAFDPYVYPENATQRRSVVLSSMVKQGYITEEQKKLAEEITVESLLVPEDKRESNGSEYQTIIDAILSEVRKKYDLEPNNVPMIIDTTFDLDVQDVLVKLDNEELGYKFINDKVETAISVIDVHDGSIAALLGRRNQNGRKELRNLATTMVRHPGSTAKPIVDYGPYLEYYNGSTYTPFFDEKNMTYSNGQSIKNSNDKYMGIMTMRTALVYSRNVPALQAFQKLDKDKAADFIASLGIHYGGELYESYSIGGFDGVSPVELSAAYAAFASGGYYTEPYSVKKITIVDTEEVIEANPKRERVMSEETAFMINSMLMSTKVDGGVAGNLSVPGTDLAAKSGTSTYDTSSSKIQNSGLPQSIINSLSRDNWVDVYSPDYSIAVWYGYEDFDKDYYTTANSGDNERKKITAAIGKEIFKLKPAARFEIPDGVVQVEVEKWTFPAQLPSEYTPKTTDEYGSSTSMTTTEYFRKGTEPTKVSERFSKLSNPKNGEYTYNGSTVTISWDPIKTPDAINPEYLQKYFTTYYDKWAEEYYQKRLQYNEKHIGTIGYNVYLKSADGLTSLGYTTEPTFTHECPTGDCTYVVKSAYSIFKDNMSSGLEIETKGSTEIPDNVTFSFNGGEKGCFKVEEDGTYNSSNSIIVYQNGIDVTTYATITMEYYLDDEKVDKIDLSKPATYTIKYTIVYNGKTYNVNRTINVCENGCSEDNICT